MATGDILSARIERPIGASDYGNLDGWVLSIIIEGWGGKTVSSIDLGWTAPNNSLGNDPDSDNPTVVVSLSRSGFQVSGTTVSTTTRSRTLYGTKRIRKVYPLNTQFLTDVVGDDLRVYIGLSGHVYASDSSITVSIDAGVVTAADAATSNAASGLSVANNSALVQPKVKATILNRASSLPFTRQTGNYVNAVHGACDGGILGLLCTLTDESTNTAEEFVAEPEVVECERTASGTLPKSYGWVTNTPITGLDQGELMTARFRMYPIDGDAESVYDSSDFSAAGSPHHQRPRTHRIDHAGTWPTVYVYVDAANGDNGTGVASETAGTARAAPFAHMWNALLAARNYINTTYSRSNSLDGVVCRFMDNAGVAQDFVWGRTGFAATMTAPGAAPILEADPENTAAVRLRTKESQANILCDRILFRIPIQPSAAAQTNFIGSTSSDDWYVFDRINSIKSESSSGSAPILNTGVEQATPYCCKMEDLYSSFPPGYWPEISGWEVATGFQNANLPFVGVVLENGVNAWNVNASPGVFGNSVEVTNQRILSCEFSVGAAPFYDAGAKLTNCLMASTVAKRLGSVVSSQPLIAVNDIDIEDTLWQDVSALGQRTNIQNQTSPDTDYDRFFLDSFASDYIASKHDTFAEDGTLISSWDQHWGVGWENIYNGTNDIFPFEFDGLHVWGQPDSVGDRFPETVDGLDDVTPTATSELAGLIRAGTVPSKRFDINGVEVPNDGTGYAGGLQGQFSPAGRRRSRIF